VRKKSTRSLPLHQTSSKPPQNKINMARLTNNSSKKTYSRTRNKQQRRPTTETTNNRDDQPQRRPQRYRCLHTRTGSYDLRLSLAAASIYTHPQLHIKPTPRGRTIFKLIPADGTWRETRKSSATFPTLTPSSDLTSLCSPGSKRNTNWSTTRS
jgi:hypothetical protein